MRSSFVKKISVLSWCLVIAFLHVGESEGTERAVASGSPIMPLNEVEKGMSGHGMSVFSGTKPERFEFTVIGKLENRLPKQSLIIVRLSGQNLEHSGTIAGMSGSPLYIDGRMIGAVSYAWGFAKDPIAGVTPIENMLEDLSRDARTSGELLARSRAQDVWGPYLVDANLGAALQRLGAVQTSSDERTMTPIAMPISMPAMEPELEAMFRENLRGGSILPVTASGNSTPNTAGQTPEIVPGGVLGIAFMTGDVTMSGVGTITDVVGDRLIGFGHPMMQVGATDVPMLASEIITVLANQKLSFKMATSGPVFGQLTGDFQASVVGDMSKRTNMIPVNMRVRAEELGVDERYAMRVTPMPTFAPMAIVGGFSSAIHNALPHSLAFQYRISVRWALAQGPSGTYTNHVLSSDPKEALRHVVLQPLIFALVNPYQDVDFSTFDVDVEVLPRRDLAKIVRISAPVVEARAGEAIPVRVHLLPFGSSKEVVEELTYTPSQREVGKSITIDVASAMQLMLTDTTRHTDLATYMDRLKPQGQHNELALRVRHERDSLGSDGVLFPSAPLALKALMPRSNEVPLAYLRKGEVVKKEKVRWLLSGGASIKLNILPAAN